MKATAVIEWELSPTKSEHPIEQAVKYLKSNLPKELTFHSVKVRMPKSEQSMIVLGIFKPDEVIPYVGKAKKEYRVNEETYVVNMNSQRYVVFKKNRYCVSCGIEGKFFFLETHRMDHRPHFNLYAEKDGKMILMTKDHIVAKANGGRNSMDNLQCMCSTCNNLKSDFPMSIKALSKLRDFYDENHKKYNRKQLAGLIVKMRKELMEKYPLD